MKTCIACGMPMNDASDHACQDEKLDYCVYCAREDGTMHSFEEKKEGLVKFMMESQGVDEKAALQLTEQMMKELPAWKSYFE